MKSINKNNFVKKTVIFSLFLFASVALALPALADCDGVPAEYKFSVVTYYETVLPYNPDALTDSRCTIVTNSDGRRVCRIRLRGTLYVPRNLDPTLKYPAIIVNHGSEETFEANNKFCGHANFFVPKGYVLFAPFRRGHGDNDAPLPNNPTQISDKSTGIYIEDMLDDLVSGNPVYNHPTNCATRGCYKAEILQQQADQEISYAANYLKTLPYIKKDTDGDYFLAVMGSSYGGAVTALSNRNVMGQKAAIVFSPGAQNWATTTCAPDDPTCGTELQKALLAAARNATKPAFYLQAKWDYDTRATIDLAYAHAYGSSDPLHGNRFMASIFPYPKPDIDPSTGQLDFQSVHVGFFKDTDRWGRSVLDFLRLYDVK
jgi:dienelactone hydrolase